MKTTLLVLFCLLFTPSLFANSRPLAAEEKLGFQVVNLESGKVVAEQNAQELFIPASTAKIVTTLYALEKLGADYRFATQLYSTGTIQDGQLKGTLYLRGNGDPMLLAAEVFNLALELKSVGVTKVEGEFIYDSSLLPEIFQITNNGPLDTTDNPGVSALNIEFNRFKVYGQDNSLSPTPTLPNVLIDYSPAPLEESAVRQAGETEKWLVDKSQATKFPLHLPIKDASAFTAHYFVYLAKLAGIDLPLPKRGITPTSATLLAQHLSPPLIQLVDLNLEYSNNLMAEALLLKAASSQSKVETLEHAGTVMKKWLVDYSKNQVWQLSHFSCGSGLDDTTQFSPSMLTSLLYQMKDVKFGDRYYRSLLSISGIKGWMYKRLDTPAYSHRIWSKTGTLNFSGGMTGYFYGKSGKAYAFTLLTTDWQKRQQAKEAKGAQKKQLLAASEEWNKVWREKHDQMLKKWIEEN